MCFVLQISWSNQGDSIFLTIKEMFMCLRFLLSGNQIMVRSFMLQSLKPLGDIPKQKTTNEISPLVETLSDGRAALARPCLPGGLRMTEEDTGLQSGGRGRRPPIASRNNTTSGHRNYAVTNGSCSCPHSSLITVLCSWLAWDRCEFSG